jgi:hypothetical protein
LSGQGIRVGGEGLSAKRLELRTKDEGGYTEISVVADSDRYGKNMLAIIEVYTVFSR